jgi:hypothetical protein
VIANLLPARVRKGVYVGLATAFGIEAVWDVLPEGLEGRILLTLGVLGFGLAAGNTPKV